MATSKLLASLALILLVLGVCKAEDDEKKNITVTPDHILEQTNKDVELKCSSDTGFSVYWVNPNNTIISQLNDTRFEDDGNGTLMIREVQLWDSGNYTCWTKEREFGFAVEVKIYAMPTYFMEGMIILVVNAVLIIIFLICLIQSTIQHRRMAAKQGYKDMKMQQEIQAM